MTIALACGILWHAAGFFWWLPFIIIIACSIIAQQQNTTTNSVTSHAVFLGASSFLFGVALYAWHDYRWEIQKAELCTSSSTVDGIITKVTPHSHPVFTHCYTVKITNATIRSAPRTLYRTPSILIYTNESTAFKNDKIHIEKAYIRPAHDDFRYYAHQQDCIGSCFVRSVHLTIQKNKEWSLSRWIDYKRNTIMKSFQEQMSPTTFNLFSLMFLGYKKTSEQLDTLRDHFMYWGISHYLARSGLHLVIIILIFHALLSLLRLPSGVKEIIIIPSILLYALLSWNSISFLRALCTACMYALCNITITAYHTLYIISLICCVLLVAQPIYLFALDFQLSFGLTFALALLQEIKNSQKTPTSQTIAV